MYIMTSTWMMFGVNAAEFHTLNFYLVEDQNCCLEFIKKEVDKEGYPGAEWLARYLN